jgi:hypothetical protein
VNGWDWLLIDLSEPRRGLGGWLNSFFNFWLG